MVPIREQAISAVVSTLAPLAGGNISRCLPANDDYPAIVIWDVDEDVDSQYGVTTADAPVTVEYFDVYDSAITNPSTHANTLLANLIKTLIGSDPSLGGAVDSCRYAGAIIDYPESAVDVVAVRATFIVRYRYKSGDPFTTP